MTCGTVADLQCCGGLMFWHMQQTPSVVTFERSSLLIMLTMLLSGCHGRQEGQGRGSSMMPQAWKFASSVMLFSFYFLSSCFFLVPLFLFSHNFYHWLYFALCVWSICVTVGGGGELQIQPCILRFLHMWHPPWWFPAKTNISPEWMHQTAPGPSSTKLLNSSSSLKFKSSSSSLKVERLSVPWKTSVVLSP